MSVKKLRKLVLLPLLLLRVEPAVSQDIDQDLQDALNYLAWINTSSMVEPSGSVGSYGVPVSLGLNHNNDPIQKTDVISAIFEKNIDTGVSQSSKLNILKGTEWPVDLGLSANQYDGLNIMSLALLAQVTLFEGFHLPAVSIRAMASRLYGVHNARVNNQAAEFAVSYGISRYLKIYTAIRSERSHINIELNEATVMLLDQMEKDDSRSQVASTVNINIGLFGVKIPITETISFVSEAARSISDQPSNTLSGKISIIL